MKYFHRVIPNCGEHNCCQIWLCVSSEYFRSKLIIDNSMCIFRRLRDSYNEETFHDDVIKWKHFLHYWPFVWGIHRWLPLTNASDAEIWRFRWSTTELTVEYTIVRLLIWDLIRSLRRHCSAFFYSYGQPLQCAWQAVIYLLGLSDDDYIPNSQTINQEIIKCRLVSDIHQQVIS